MEHISTSGKVLPRREYQVAMSILRCSERKTPRSEVEKCVWIIIGGGKRLCRERKDHLFSLSALCLGVRAEKYTYSHSDLFLKKGKTNCKGATKKKRELINYPTKQGYALEFN